MLQPQDAAAREELEFLTRELRTVASPRELVEKYAQALKTRNGALARAFLAPEIKDQVLPGVIGVSTLITAVPLQKIQSWKVPLRLSSLAEISLRTL